MMRSNLAAVAALLLASCGNAPDESKYKFAAEKLPEYVDYGAAKHFTEAVAKANHSVRFGEDVGYAYYAGEEAKNLRHISERELTVAFAAKFLRNNHGATAIVPLLDGKVATISGFSIEPDIKVRGVDSPCDLDYSKAPFVCPELKRPLYLVFKKKVGAN